MADPHLEQRRHGAQRFHGALPIDIGGLELPHRLDSPSQKEIRRGAVQPLRRRSRSNHHLHRVLLYLYSYRLFFDEHLQLSGWFEYFNGIEYDEEMSKAEL